MCIHAIIDSVNANVDSALINKIVANLNITEGSNPTFEYYTA